MLATGSTYLFKAGSLVNLVIIAPLFGVDRKGAALARITSFLAGEILDLLVHTAISEEGIKIENFYPNLRITKTAFLINLGGLLAATYGCLYLGAAVARRCGYPIATMQAIKLVITSFVLSTLLAIPYWKYSARISQRAVLPKN